jgi:hypothetical protein
VTRTILRRLRSLEEAQRLCSALNEGTRYKELLRAKLESMAQACRHDPTWRELTPEEDWDPGAQCDAILWHKMAENGRVLRIQARLEASVSHLL